MPPSGYRPFLMPIGLCQILSNLGCHPSWCVTSNLVQSESTWQIRGASDREITGGSPVSTASHSSVRSRNLQAEMMPRHVRQGACTWVSLIYLSLLLYFPSAYTDGTCSQSCPPRLRDPGGGGGGGGYSGGGGGGGGVFFWRSRTSCASGTNGFRHSKERSGIAFPCLLHIELPATDPVAPTYCVVFFVLVFGLGIYVQGDLFRSFYTGVVYLDSPNSEDIQAQDPRVFWSVSPHRMASSSAEALLSTTHIVPQVSRSVTTTTSSRTTD